jgi:DNA-binding GntR family transcriptional regulator
LEPFIQESTPSIIARKLRYAIAHGAVAPGSQLGEADVARELGVSRGPLREAMQRLTQEGLLVSIRNRGLFVIEMTDAEIRDMYVLRTAVESAACKMLVRADHVAAGQDLLSKVAEMETAAVTGDRTAMSDADMAFHEHLVALSGSRSLVRIHTTLMIETRMCLTVLQDSCRSPMNGSRNIAASPRPCGAAMVRWPRAD